MRTVGGNIKEFTIFFKQVSKEFSTIVGLNQGSSVSLNLIMLMLDEINNSL